MKVSIRSKNGHKTLNINRRRAIRERCLNCCGWNSLNVTYCNFSCCPLHPYRKSNGKQDAKKRSKAIRRYCIACMNGQRGEVAKCSSMDCPLFAYRLNKIDRSIEIKFESCKDHIGTISQTKKVRVIPEMQGDLLM